MKVEKKIWSRIRGGEALLGFTMTVVWDSDDPLAVRLSFPQNGKDLHWVFSRELLHRGVFFTRAGETHGDVAIWQEGEMAVISLRPPHGRADVECKKKELRAFIETTTSHTAIGKEGPRIEAAIQNLIDDINQKGA